MTTESLKIEGSQPMAFVKLPIQPGEDVRINRIDLSGYDLDLTESPIVLHEGESITIRAVAGHAVVERNAG